MIDNQEETITEEQAEADKKLKLMADEEKLQMFGLGLERLAQEQMAIRQRIEDRWIEDLQQYMGQYDAETSHRLAKSGGSQAFVNITRPKTTAAEARLTDMLFPSDDKNWGIQPTPVPELQQLTNNQDIAQLDERGNPVTFADIAKEHIKQATQIAENMAREIDDQLVEAKYHQTARDVIHEGCLYGTGVLKGPIVINKERKKWAQIQGNVYVLDMQREFRPGVEHVTVWDFYPDMSASRIDDCGFIFERRYYTKKQLRGLAHRPGYLKDQIKRVIAETPRPISATQGGAYIAKMRELSGINANIDDNRYEVWEYHGPLDKDNLRICGCDVEDFDSEELEGIVVFVNGRVIKADLNPMESNEQLYSTFCYEKDDTSVFGIGVPRLLNNEQRIANAAWRMALDNAALSTGPQIVANREFVEPADGNWQLASKKVWWITKPGMSVRDVFHAFEINSHQQELTAIYEMAKNMADDVTNLPMLAQGEVGDAPDTASGMSMLMNSANVVIRRVVKNFDDGITKPFIGRMYDWNMQNSEKEDIKGDFEIDARGSSALLVKETQSAALKELMSITSTNEIYADLTKHAALLRKAVEAQHISPDDIVKTDQEIEAEKSNQSPEQQHQQQMMELELKRAEADIAKIKADSTLKNVTSLYESMQAGQIVATIPSVAPISDAIAESAGFEDRNGYPIVTPPEQPIPAAQDQIPVSPGLGKQAGIETMRNDGVINGVENVQPKQPQMQ